MDAAHGQRERMGELAYENIRDEQSALEMQSGETKDCDTER